MHYLQTARQMAGRSSCGLRFKLQKCEPLLITFLATFFATLRHNLREETNLHNPHEEAIRRVL
jgi:hypothetical protein